MIPVEVAGFCEQYGFRVKLPLLLRVLIEQYGVISQARADLSPAATLLINEPQRDLIT